MIAPASSKLAEEFGITNEVIIALTTSIFVLAYGGLQIRTGCVKYLPLIHAAIGPLFLGPMSEIYGRSHVLQLANLWYLGRLIHISIPVAPLIVSRVAWNLGCGFAQNKEQLIVFRFLAGLGGSAPLSIGGGVLGDCWRAEQRGQAMAIYSLAPLLGPVIGPLCGAWYVDQRGFL